MWALTPQSLVSTSLDSIFSVCPIIENDYSPEYYTTLGLFHLNWGDYKMNYRGVVGLNKINKGGDR